MELWSSFFQVCSVTKYPCFSFDPLCHFSFFADNCFRVLDIYSLFYSAREYDFCEKWCGMAMKMLDKLDSLKSNYDTHVSFQLISLSLHLGTFTKNIYSKLKFRMTDTCGHM